MTETPDTRPAFARDARVVLPTRHPARWAMAAVVVLIVAGGITQVVGNERFQWGVVGDYLFAAPILQGVGKTLMLTAPRWRT